MIGADTTFLVQLEVVELPTHQAACELLRREVIDQNVSLALAPQTLAEFIHVVTDLRRFQRPLSVTEAINKARFWWEAKEVQHVFPSDITTNLFFDWMHRYQLGRKRILDTQLAATFWSSGIHRIITSNPTDFQLFGFEVIIP